MKIEKKKYFAVNIKAGKGKISDSSIEDLEKDGYKLILESSEEEYKSLMSAHDVKINEDFKLTIGELMGLQQL